MGLVMRLLYAAAIAVVVWLICVFFGGLLAITHQPIMAYVGGFIQAWAILIAVVAFLLVFAGGGSLPLPTWTRRS